jgi:hypothetical protein
VKVIVTTVGSFLTGSELADSVLAFSLALARPLRTAVVNVPYLSADGVVGRVELTVGHATTLALTSHSGADEELTEPGTVAEIVARTHALLVPTGQPFAEEDLVVEDWPRFE